MNEVVEKKNSTHQGRNIRFAREFKGLSQQDLGDKINKQQSEISKIENQEVIENEILERIAHVLDISADFLRNFDFRSATKNFYNDATIHSAGKSQDVVNQGDQSQIFNYYPLEQVMEMTTKLLNMQKEHYEKEMRLLEEKHEIDKEKTLLKQELEFLKSSK